MWKVLAIAVGVLVAFFVVGSIVHVIISALITVAIAALVVGGIYVAIKVSRSGKQVSGKSKDSEIRDRRASSSALPGVDLDQYTAPAPPRPATPRPAAPRPSSADVDDELARLKREMGS
ncbi:MAG TPA: hypothetical protein VFB06_35825 [Streptosporangiaceae bacterium]|nr:hypothetical protein [Streptosporangiaceae bacterium]